MIRKNTNGKSYVRYTSCMIQNKKKNEVMNGPYNLHFKKYKNDKDMDAIHAHLKIIYR